MYGNCYDVKELWQHLQHDTRVQHGPAISPIFGGFCEAKSLKWMPGIQQAVSQGCMPGQTGKGELAKYDKLLCYHCKN